MEKFLENLEQYIYISGAIMLFWLYYDLYYSKKSEEFQEKIESISWQCDLDKNIVMTFVIIAVIVFAWIFLPVKIVRSIRRAFGEE